MEFQAKQKWVRLSAQKARLVADVVRGMDVQKAVDTLKFMPQKAALHISRAVRSALANAREHKRDPKPDVDRLFVRVIMIDVGPSLKRMKPRAYGRANRIMRRTSHITVVLAERPADEAGRGRAGRRVRIAGKGGAPAKGDAGKKAAPEAAKAEGKPKKPRLLKLRAKEKYEPAVKGGGDKHGESSGEHRKTERGTQDRRKGK